MVVLLCYVVVIVCGRCIYVVIVAVHGHFVAGAQTRIHLDERSPQ